MLFFACKKNNDAPVATTGTDIAAASKSIDGNILTGKVTVTYDAEGLWLSVDRYHIVVSQLPGLDLDTMTDMPAATVVTSQHGLIVKNQADGKLYFLVNCDPESIGRFERVAALFPQGAQKNFVFGTTVVRPSNS